MKKTFVIFLILVVATLVAYFILDRQLYYYGKSNFTFYQKLPLKIKPQYWDYDMGNLGFVLVDDSEMTIVSKGDCQYVGSDKKFTVKEIIKYGYTDEKLIAQIQDTTGKKYLIECLKNNNDNSKQDMAINVLDNANDVNYDEYKWVEIKDTYFRKIEGIRNYLVITFIISFIGSIYFGLRRNKP